MMDVVELAETKMWGDMPRGRLVWYVDTFSCKIGGATTEDFLQPSLEDEEKGDERGAGRL